MFRSSRVQLPTRPGWEEETREAGPVDAQGIHLALTPDEMRGLPLAEKA